MTGKSEGAGIEISSGADSLVTVNGDIKTDGARAYGVNIRYGGTAVVNGNIASAYVGVGAQSFDDEAFVTINGTLQSDEHFIMLTDDNYNFVSKDASDKTIPSSKTGYAEYSLGKQFVWVLSGAHDHDYAGTATPPTCTEKGYTTYSCECGDSYTENYVDASGHSFTELTDRKDATCVADGYEIFKCVRCDETDRIDYPALKHAWSAAVTDPTCTEQGYTTYSCECGATEVDEYEPARGHDWDDGIVTLEPTDFNDGEMTFTCGRCYATKTESISATGHTHSFTGTVTAPTCTAQGYTTYACSCGKDGYVDDYRAALGHSMTVFVGSKAATCGENGYNKFKCVRCEETKTDIITATGNHVENAGVVTTEPTATKDGVKTYSCTVCGKELRTEAIPATGTGDFKLIVKGVELDYEIINGVVVIKPKQAQMTAILNATGNEIIFDLTGFDSVDIQAAAGWFKDVDKTVTIITNNGKVNVKTKTLWNNSGKIRLIKVRNNTIELSNI
jgi:hypothetical protein